MQRGSVALPLCPPRHRPAHSHRSAYSLHLYHIGAALPKHAHRGRALGASTLAFGERPRPMPRLLMLTSILDDSTHVTPTQQQSRRKLTPDAIPRLHTHPARKLNGQRTLELDRIHTALLEHAHRRRNRVADAGLVAAERKVANEERTPRAARYGPGVRRGVGGVLGGGVVFVQGGALCGKG
eukprot:365666-Chlamydomonas_euryale.AAC.1